MAKIVNAIIIKDNKILGVKRSKEPYLGMYNLPGGHVDSGETHEEALVRELKEETNQDILITKFLEMIPNNNNECYIFSAEIINENNYNTSEEIPEIKWLSIQDFIDNLERFNPENWKLLLPYLK
jgi:ADP-ribose pyrophosphatase YjhB (NUDIX family)